jgi:hypothetical protein
MGGGGEFVVIVPGMLVRTSQYKDGREVELSVFIIDLRILISVIDIRKVISGIWHLLVSVVLCTLLLLNTLVNTTE